jgi:hypothetical protein
MRLYSLGPALAGRSSDPVERGMIAKSTRRSPDFDKRGLRIAGFVFYNFNTPRATDGKYPSPL